MAINVPKMAKPPPNAPFEKQIRTPAKATRTVATVSSGAAEAAIVISSPGCGCSCYRKPSLRYCKAGFTVHARGKDVARETQIDSDVEQHGTVADIAMLAEMGILDGIEIVPVGSIAAYDMGCLAGERASKTTRIFEAFGAHAFDIDAAARHPVSRRLPNGQESRS